MTPPACKHLASTEEAAKVRTAAHSLSLTSLRKVRPGHTNQLEHIQMMLLGAVMLFPLQTTTDAHFSLFLCTNRLD